MNRKEFLKFILLSSMSWKAQAQYHGSKKQTSVQKKKNYILFNFWDSPPRWIFDCLLQPSSSSKFKSHPMICNCLAKDGSPIYQTFKHQGLNFPLLLSQQIQTPRGKVLLADIFNQTLFIRGCDMNRDGHEINNKMLEAQSFGGISLGGQISTFHERPIAGIGSYGHSEKNRGAISSFKNRQGLGATTCHLDDGPLMQQILSVFEKSDEPFKINLSDPETTALLEKLAALDGKKSQLDMKKFLQLAELPMEQIYQHFKISHAKYKKLLDSLRDQKLLKETLKFKDIENRFPASFKLRDDGSVDPVDYLGRFRVDDWILNEKVESVFEGAQYDFMADHFALLETALHFKLTSVLLVNLDPLGGLKVTGAAPITKIKHEIKDGRITFDIDSKDLVSEGQKVPLTFNNDPHFIGLYTTLYGFSLQFQLFAVCLHEFIQTLKEQGLFEDSLLHITSEFERAPNKTSSGSDHGWRGHSSTLISGAFEKADVVGNIKVSSPNTMKDAFCTWGEGSPMELLSRTMRYADIMTTITTFFEVPRISGGKSLLKKKGKRWVPSTEEADNVG